MTLETARLRLVLQSAEALRVFLEQLSPEQARHLSADWLALAKGAVSPDPWIHGFIIRERQKEVAVGQCGFKGPPNSEGSVEIAYAIDPGEQGNGYATEAAGALTRYALSHPIVRIVRAHTLPERNASARVLTKAGFQKIGEVIDPDDGLVWRWEIRRTPVGEEQTESRTAGSE